MFSGDLEFLFCLSSGFKVISSVFFPSLFEGGEMKIHLKNSDVCAWICWGILV